MAQLKNSTWLAKAAYFFYFAAAASLLPFLTLYYSNLGLSGSQIGLLSGIVPIITLLSASIWGGIADATQRHKAVLITAIGGTWISVLALSRITDFLWLLPVVVIYAIFVASIVPLIDNSVMEILSGRKQDYGKIRLWGAVGWGLVATFAGLLIEREGMQMAFYSYLSMAIALVVIVIRLPVAKSAKDAPYLVGIRRLMSNRLWIRFILMVLIQGMSMSIMLNYLFLHMEALGASKTLMGLSLTASTASEVPFWFFAGNLIDRFGRQRVLVFSLLIFAVRAFGYAFMQDPWLVLPLGLLHGPSFSTLWTAGVSFASDNAPKGLGATAQGLFSGSVFGLGGGLGGFFGGLMYEQMGGALTFQWVGVGLLVGMAFYLVTWRRGSRAVSFSPDS